METRRKTKKYYRDLIAKQGINTQTSVIKEIFDRYVTADKWGRKQIYLPKETVKFNWNHRIEHICSNKNYPLFFSIYWQGDSTDGNDGADALEVLQRIRGGRDYVIPAEHEFLGDRTYCRHGDLRIEKEELEQVFQALIGYLKPTKK